MARIDQDITERATKHVQSVLLGPCPNVRFGSLADIGQRIRDVRFAPKKADIRQRIKNVCFLP
jgi:hypothetical protein